VKAGRQASTDWTYSSSTVPPKKADKPLACIKGGAHPPSQMVLLKKNQEG